MPSFAPDTLQLLLENVADVMVLLDTDRRILYLNRSHVGTSPQELIGQPMEALVPPPILDGLGRAFDDAEATGVVQRYQLHTGRDHGDRVFDVIIAPVPASDGSHLGWTFCSRDMTESATVVSDFATFFAISDEYLVVVDRDGCIERASESFRTLGFDPDELVGTPVLESVHPDDVEKVRAAMGERRAQVEFRVQPDDAHEMLLAGWFSRTDDGRVFAAARDITVERMTQQRAMASQKLEAVGQLAGGVAHDFNNLLLSVLLNADEGLQDLPPDHPAADRLRDIRDAAQLSADLTKQLLAFSRRTHRPRDVDLNEVTSRMIAVLRRTIPQSVEIDFIPGHKLGWVHADPGQLEQIILNLAVNARDAMPQGGRLSLSTQNVVVNGEYRKNHPWAKAGRYVLLTVTDTGAGIPEEVLDKIFEPFFSSKGVGYGTGLGLTIVQDVVARHEGMLHVYSEVDRGTTFKLYLPVSVMDANDVPRTPEGRVPGGRELILVAEDEPFVQRVLKRLLERAGYQVVLVGDGRDALRKLDEGLQPDLILMDVVMPVVSGPKAVEAIQARGPHPPIILASGYADQALASHALKGIPLVEKPFEPDALLRIIRQKLDEAD